MTQFLTELMGWLIAGIFWLALFVGIWRIFVFLFERAMSNFVDTELLYRAYAQYLKEKSNAKTP